MRAHRDFWLLISSSALMSTVSGMLFYMLPLLFSHDSRLIWLYGLTFSLMMVGMLISSIVGGLLADRLGSGIMIRIPVAAVSLILLFMYLLVPRSGVVWLAVLAPLYGLIGGLSGPVIHSLISKMVPMKSGGKAFSLLNLAITAGELSGPIILAILLEATGLSGVLVVMLALAVATAFLRWVIRPMDRQFGGGARGFVGAISKLLGERDVRILLALMIVLGTAEGLYSTYLIPYLTTEVMMSLYILTLTYTAIKLIHLGAQLPVGMLVDRIGYTRVILISSLLSSLVAITLPFVRDETSVIAILLLGAFAMMMNDPAIKVAVAENSPTSVRATMFGLSNSLVVLSQSPMIIAGGFLWQAWPGGVYILSSVMFAGSISFVSLLRGKDEGTGFQRASGAIPLSNDG